MPFGEPAAAERSLEEEVESYMKVPTANFPTYLEVLPRFAKAVDLYRSENGALAFPTGVSPRSMLQRTMRETLTAKGLDVSGLTDTQMTDYQYWLFFPNVFIQICAGDATVIIAEPHPDGDPNRCVWHVMGLQWLPLQERTARRAATLKMPEGQHFDYNFVLQQDFDQMEIQQGGLRNKALKSMVLTKNEPRVAHFHAILDSWVQ